MKNMAAPLIGMGLIPTSRGPLDALTVSRAPKNQRMNVFKQVVNPMTAMDRSKIATMYAEGGRVPGTLN